MSEAGTLDHYLSDHQPIYVVKKKQRDCRSRVEFSGRSYRNFDKGKFKDQLRSCQWETFYKIENPDGAWEFLLSQLTPILNQMCPIRKYTIKNYRPGWVTNELVEQIKDRDYFYKEANRTGDGDFWNIARHLRNTTNSNIRTVKKGIYTE